MGPPHREAQALAEADLRRRPLDVLPCATLPPGTDGIPGGDIEQAALELVDHLQADVQKTPLALFASLFIEHDQLGDAARRMFGAYDEFLAILNDDDKREHLDELSQPELVATDPVYQRVRERGTSSRGRSMPSSSTRQAVPRSMS